MAHRIELMTPGSVEAGKKGLVSRQPIRVYSIDDTLTDGELGVVRELLIDPIADVASTRSVLWDSNQPIPDETTVIEMSPKPGVNDPHGKAVKKAIERTIGRQIGGVSFSQQFLWNGALDNEGYTQLIKKLGNTVVNDFTATGLVSACWNDKRADGQFNFPFSFPTVDLPKVEAFEYVPVELSDSELLKLSKDRYLALILKEMQAIRDLYRDKEFIERRKAVGLEAIPTDAELENFAQTWSEHCCHKKLRGKWNYTSEDTEDESGLEPVTDSLFKIIQKPAKELGKMVNWLVSIFEDNAGVIKLNDEYDLAHKVETHNHPTSISAHGGANTGTGGVIRDNESTGRGQHPVSSQYGFRTPHPDDFRDMPTDMQSPARTLEGMITGVEDYGNKMGIPTMCGQVMIDHGWLKPGCIVGCVSVAERIQGGRPTNVKDIRPGYVAITLGGKVGLDGMHGATGSSLAGEVGDEKKKDVNQSVQIGDPIVQKGVFESMDTLENLGLVEATQDCGAGGWNSALGELTGLLHEFEQSRYKIKEAFRRNGITRESSYEQRIAAAPSDIGLDKVASPFADELKMEIASGEIFDIQTNGKGGSVVDLSHVPEKYAGLTGWQKQVSEAQEREIVVVKKENLERVLEICKHNNVEAMQIAEFNNTGYYQVLDQEKTINYLPIEFMNQRLPQMTINAHWKPCQNKEPEIEAPKNLTGTLLDLIGSPNMQSFAPIMTRFDHEVQGGSRIKPLVGVGNAKSDAIAYTPVLGCPEVVIETWGSNPWQGDIDAYHMGRNAVVDAVGRVIAAGGNLPDEDTYKLTFNGNTLCPRPEADPEVAAKVMRMLKGAADAQIEFGTATISGKDSTSMEKKYISTETGKEVNVKAKPELYMSAMAVVPDDSTLTTCDFKLPGDLIYVVGETRDELGGSEYYLSHGEVGRNVPKSKAELRERFAAVRGAVEKGLIHSAQYVGKGGLGAAIANSAMGGDLGAVVELNDIDNGLGRADKILFSETTGRFVVTVHPSNKYAFEESMKGVYAKEVGAVRSDDEVCVRYGARNVVSTDVRAIREKNKGGIKV